MGKSEQNHSVLVGKRRQPPVIGYPRPTVAGNGGEGAGSPRCRYGVERFLEPAVLEQKMYRIVATAVLASLAFAVQAADGVELSLRTKALASASMAPSASVAPKSDAPFAAGRDPLPQLLLLEEQERRGPNGAGCEFTARDVCYDLTAGRVVYRGARAFMPAIEGLTPESVSLRSSRVTFKYSFK